MQSLFHSIITVPLLLPLFSWGIIPTWIPTEMITFQELQNTPLYQMEDVPNTFNTLFWNLQAETILGYNGLSTKKAEDEYVSIKQLQYPLIYPELLNYFPSLISWFEEKNIKFSTTEKKYLGEDNIILIFRNDENKNMLAYYQTWELKLATYITIGDRTSRTKPWIYRVKKNLENRRSRKYPGEPMPYALQYDWDYFLHRWDTSENENSHGCIRVPWLYQKRLYEHIPSKKTAIIIHKPYEISLYKED